MLGKTEIGRQQYNHMMAPFSRGIWLSLIFFKAAFTHH